MPPQLVTPSPSAHPPGLGLHRLPRAEGGGMTRLPPQPDDNPDQAAASIPESEVPARSTVRAVNEPGRPGPAFRYRCAHAGRAPRRIARWRARHGAAQRCRLIPIWPHSATGRIRPLHVIADMKGDGSTDRSLHPGMKRPSQRKPSSKCAEPGDLQSLNGPRPTDFLHTKSAGSELVGADKWSLCVMACRIGRNELSLAGPGGSGHH
jgi:hypothetical protein